MDIEFIAGIRQTFHKFNRALKTPRSLHPNCIWDFISFNTSDLSLNKFNLTNSMSPLDEQPADSEADNLSSSNGRWDTAFFSLQLYVLPLLAAVALANNTAIVFVAALSRAFRGAIFPSVRRIVLSIAVADIGVVLFYHMVIWLGVLCSAHTPCLHLHSTCVAMFFLFTTFLPHVQTTRWTPGFSRGRECSVSLRASCRTRARPRRSGCSWASRFTRSRPLHGLIARTRCSPSVVSLNSFWVRYF